MMEANSSEVLPHSSSRKQHDGLVPREDAPKKSAHFEAQIGGLRSFLSKEAKAETGMRNVASTSTASARTPHVLSFSTSLSQSWAKGLQVLERRQKDRGIEDASVYTDSTSNSHRSSFASSQSTAYSHTDHSKRREEGEDEQSQTNMSGVVSATSGVVSATSGVSAVSGQEEDESATTEPREKSFFDNLMENLSHPSQILGISTSDSNETLSQDNSSEQEPVEVVELTKTRTSARTTSNIAGVSFDIIDFNDIHHKAAPPPLQQPTMEEISESSTAFSGSLLTSTEELKQRFRDYVDLNAPNMDPKTIQILPGIQEKGEPPLETKDSPKGRNPQWNKAGSKVMLSIKHSKARLMDSVRGQARLIESMRGQLPPSSKFEKFKRRHKESTEPAEDISSPLPVRMKTALNKTRSAVSGKRPTRNYTQVINGFNSNGSDACARKDAVDSIDVSEPSVPAVHSIEASKHLVPHLELSSLARKSVTPWNHYVKRKSQEYKHGASNVMSSIRRSVRRGKYEDIGDDPETQETKIVEHQSNLKEMDGEEELVQTQPSIDDVQTQPSIEDDPKPPESTLDCQHLFQQRHAPALIFANDDEIETSVQVQAGILQKGRNVVSNTMENDMEPSQGGEASPLTQLCLNLTDSVEFGVEITKMKSDVSDALFESKVGGEGEGCAEGSAIIAGLNSSLDFAPESALRCGTQESRRCNRKEASSADPEVSQVEQQTAETVPLRECGETQKPKRTDLPAMSGKESGCGNDAEGIPKQEDTVDLSPNSNQHLSCVVLEYSSRTSVCGHHARESATSSKRVAENDSISNLKIERFNSSKAEYITSSKSERTELVSALEHERISDKRLDGEPADESSVQVNLAAEEKSSMKALKPQDANKKTVKTDYTAILPPKTEGVSSLKGKNKKNPGERFSSEIASPEAPDSNPKVSTPKALISPLVGLKPPKKASTSGSFKCSIPPILPRSRNSHGGSKATKSLPEESTIQVASGGTRGVVARSVCDIERTCSAPLQIPEVLPLSKRAISAAQGGKSVSSADIVAAVTSGDNSVEMIVGPTSSAKESKPAQGPLVNEVANFFPNAAEQAQDSPQDGTSEQKRDQPRKVKSSIKARTLNFLKPKRKIQGPQNDCRGTGKESHSIRPPSPKEDIIRPQSQSIGPASLKEVFPRPESHSIGPSPKENLLRAQSVKKMAEKCPSFDLPEHAVNEPRSCITELSADAKEQNETVNQDSPHDEHAVIEAHITEPSAKEQNEKVCHRRPKNDNGGFLPDFSCLFTNLCCEATKDDTRDDWVDGCRGKTDSDAESSAADSAEVNNNSIISSPVLMNEMFVFDCQPECNDDRFGLVGSNFSSVTTNSANGSLGSRNDIVVEKGGSPDAKIGDTRTIPSQWVEIPKRQVKAAKTPLKKNEKGESGVKKRFLNLVKRKKKVGKVSDKKCLSKESGLDNEHQRMDQVHERNNDAAANIENEASWISSFLSESGASSNSWTNNSDVFSGVVSGRGIPRQLCDA